MNKQSNVYTIIYIIVIVIVVGAGLAVTSMSLKDRQIENANADKMKQILASVHITVPEGEKVSDVFNKYITSQIIVNEQGKEIGTYAFGVDVQEQSKIKDTSKRQLPIYICTLPDSQTKYIIPVYGAGLWGPIWGYVAVDSDGSTVYGAFFAHQGETPGLGAEIEKPDFSNQFTNKQLFKNGQYLPIAVVKKGQQPPHGEDYVDGISGGTITSKGVSAMLNDCMTPYKAYLENLKK